jgi:hypothetical protein
MRSKTAKWKCFCGKPYTGKWSLYHHIEHSHLREVLDDLEQDISVIKCRYCDDNNKPINESSTREHARRHHMKPGIDNFILYKCIPP